MAHRGAKTANINHSLLHIYNMTHQFLFLGSLGGQEIIIIALVILLLFGGKKIPELMRGLGKGVSQFKKGMNEIEQEITAEPEKNNEVQNK